MNELQVWEIRETNEEIETLFDNYGCPFTEDQVTHKYAFVANGSDGMFYEGIIVFGYAGVFVGIMAFKRFGDDEPIATYNTTTFKHDTAKDFGDIVTKIKEHFDLGLE